jgi:hypothetical protein
MFDIGVTALNAPFPFFSGVETPLLSPHPPTDCIRKHAGHNQALATQRQRHFPLRIRMDCSRQEHKRLILQPKKAFRYPLFLNSRSIFFNFVVNCRNRRRRRRRHGAAAAAAARSSSVLIDNG